MRRHQLWLVGVACLVPIAAPGFTARRPAESPSAPSPSGPRTTRDGGGAPKPRRLRPRDHIAVGDRWRVRVSRYPMQMPDPEWLPPETWLFSAYGIERTKDGPRLMVTATREGAAKPSVFLQLDPDTQAVTRADTILPVQGGERPFTERPAPGEPFFSQFSPVLIALPTPAVKEHATRGEAGAAEVADGKQQPEKESGALPLAPAGEQKPQGFVFGPQFTQRTEPIDEASGRAKIQNGLSALNLRRGADPGPFGVPRYLTVIEGAGLRVEEVWDETTPWPLYSQTDTSRSWLIAYAKGKSS